MICTVDQDQDRDQDCLTISRSRVTWMLIILHLKVAVEVGTVLCSHYYCHIQRISSVV